MVWPVWHVCSAKADVITFLSFTAFLCSFILCPKVLPVWPMYVCGQSLQVLGVNYELSKGVYGLECCFYA